MSNAALRDEILPLLTAMLKDSPVLGDSQDYALSFKFGFTSEEHASLAGLPLTRRATKKMMVEYDEAYEQLLNSKEFQPLVTEPELEVEIKEPKDGDTDDSTSQPGQMKLF